MNCPYEGYDQTEFLFDGHEAAVVFPKVPSNHRLAIKTEYWGAFPNTELALLEKGFTMAYIRNDHRWGGEEDLRRKGAFVDFLAEKYDLSTRCVPVGMSCGGLFGIKFAAIFPQKTSCLYLDAPVLNYMSCPCGFGIGNRIGGNNNEEILEALGLTLSELLCYRDMPMDHLTELVSNRIPVVMVAGDSDTTVPYIENGILLEKAYKNTGIDFSLFIKPGCDHHPHGLEDPTPVVDFILAHE